MTDDPPGGETVDDEGALEPALRIRMGNKPGASLRVKAVRWEFDQKRHHIVDVHIAEFKEVAVATSGVHPNGEKTNRCVVLVPSDTESAIEWMGFFVRGRFKVVDKVWNASLAHQMFKEFQPS